MNTYQWLVVAMVALIFGGGGYYLVRGDSYGVVEESISTSAVPLPTALVGKYTCAIEAGCKNPASLTLYEDGQTMLSIAYGEGEEVKLQKGTWEAKSSRIVLRFTEDQSQVYESPITLTIGQIGTSTLEHLTYIPTDYPEFSHPIFTKEVLP